VYKGSTRRQGQMTFIELTRILPKNRTVKWSFNPANIIYLQESTDPDKKIGCILVSVAGPDSDIDVVESYEDVKVKLKAFE